jgi:uncharacterized protein
MTLKDRLGRLTGETPVKHVSNDGEEERISELRRKIDGILNRRVPETGANSSAQRRRATPLEDIVAGEEVQTSHGSLFVSRSTLKAGDLHGQARVCDMACASMGATAFLSGHRITPDMSIDDGLFLDTETTGLMGGTGTFPFLIGLGWFEASSFVTCQLFARDFSEEGAMLRYLSDIASNKRFLVTFNGKAYDVNLLATRFILNRCEDTLGAKPHIDLLHPSRRILAHRLENARLATIEAQMLGVERHGDVPGFEIPQRYFDWLRRRDGRLIEDIFIHNRLDVISMASLLKYLTDLIEAGPTTGLSHHGDLLRLAGLINERGDSQKAAEILETLVSSHHEDVAVAARRALSLVYKKARRWDEAVGLWSSLVETDPHDPFAVQELAKFYEHHTREWNKAVELVRGLLTDSRHLNHGERSALVHRVDRLLRKISPE